MMLSNIEICSTEKIVLLLKIFNLVVKLLIEIITKLNLTPIKKASLFLGCKGLTVFVIIV